MVKFCTNKISTGNVRFSDYVNKITKPEVTKVASADEAKVKTAEADEAETSGQPQAEAKLVNVPEKEEGKKGKADNSEAETSGQPQAEAKLVNRPKVKTEAAGDQEIKEAEATGKGKGKDGEAQGTGGTDTCYCTKCGKEVKHQRGRPCNEMKCFECDVALTGVKPGDDKEDKKEAADGASFVKLAKLNSKTRQWLHDYWLNLYPKEYVDAMLEEK